MATLAIASPLVIDVTVPSSLLRALSFTAPPCDRGRLREHVTVTARAPPPGRFGLIHALTPLHALGIFAAGIVAGTINTVVGSGTLFTFPVLLQFGYSPVVANVSNTVGLVPGSAAGAFGYREELRGQRARLLRLSAASLSGGITGAILL